MTPDLIAQMRALVEESGPTIGPCVIEEEEGVGHFLLRRGFLDALGHLPELLDRCEAAEAFGAACIELAEARRFPGRDDARLMNAEENHEVHGERFAALCIPKEADRG